MTHHHETSPLPVRWVPWTLEDVRARVRTLQGDLEVAAVSLTPGLAVHQDPDAPGRYRLTHLPSGYALLRGVPLRDALVESVARGLLADHTVPAHEIPECRATEGHWRRMRQAAREVLAFGSVPCAGCRKPLSLPMVETLARDAVRCDACLPRREEAKVSMFRNSKSDVKDGVVA